jgi:hypothetical protein
MGNEPLTELEVAKLIAAGELPSPTEFHNSRFYCMRVSGTGVAWRRRNLEFCYRSPTVWLSPEMCQRVAGLPLVEQHPDKNILDGKSFYDSIVGIFIYGFVQGDTLYGIARIIDDRACAVLDGGQWDTSPSVTLDSRVVLKVGYDPLLIEDKPSLLDHVALVQKGVWSRDADETPGVEISQSSQERESADAR